MESYKGIVLEGVFAVAKPAHTSSAEVLEKLQTAFASSKLLAPLLHSQPKRPSKSDDQLFRMGHGGTLDPLAAGVLIVGVGRGTKHLQQYLACNKTYETIISFGASTDTYDCTGVIVEQAHPTHVTKALVEDKLALFRGVITQAPPIYSALKIDGKKACEYAREGKELPRQLASREMRVDECTLLEWHDPTQHNFLWPGREGAAPVPAVKIRLTVSSGFYVRSFAHDLGLACGTHSHMTSLLRTRQATFTLNDPPECPDLVPALTYEELNAGQHIWEAKLQPQLDRWIKANLPVEGHINGRSMDTRRALAEEKVNRPKQRFRGEWVADTKQERIKQQGGKFKGKWSRKPATNNTHVDATPY
ncbi:tRNA pseudouridine synthase B [Dothidotthia symphoricarpi CBS 119687]|uniref:tRNA pseudouridine(55) synthase n=1 Tax=Dothidotthia symphoricarpi CBS 119687 TaxID=1392245 RepID=A0A6A6A233_9PLEO|nr:tRNA pseudouridine synthase B [Dothidotthia symphoricarpi CBS 119687]KAF2125233.1 tRNA pseudouridine synthase B [Dothidotthia symphoricarpi CBS 119687]